MIRLFLYIGFIFILIWIVKQISDFLDVIIYNFFHRYNNSEPKDNTIYDEKHQDDFPSLSSNTNSSIYYQKKLMTDYEEYFYKILLELEEELNIRVQAQVNLRTIIDKQAKHAFTYSTELFRNIDFGIFTKDCKQILLLIEINDRSHNTTDRKIRDKKVVKICEEANVKLIKFYSKYPNEKSYVKSRIKKELLNNNNIH